MISYGEAKRLARTLVDELEHTVTDHDADDLRQIITAHYGEVDALRARLRLRDSESWYNLVWRALESAELADEEDVP